MALPKWVQILESVGPIVLQFTPLAPIAPIVVAGINIAESIPGATGANKKTYVEQLVALAAQAANTQTGKTLLDPTSAAGAAGTAIDAIVSVVNLIHNNTPSPVAAPVGGVATT